MSKDAAAEPLLGPTFRTNNPSFPKRRRLRRCKSAPLVDYGLRELDSRIPLLPPQSQSIFNLRPSFKRVCLFLVLYLGIGTVCFYLIAPQIHGKKTDGILDAVYFCIVTMTTVGYGDLVPDSVPSKLLACAFVFTGMALVGMVLSEAADYLVEKQELLLVRALNMNKRVGQIEIMKELKTNRVRYKCVVAFLILVLVMLAGTIFLVMVEKLDVVDAFYCVCSTITTLGYGDKSFSTKAGRIFAVFWILTGTVCLAQFFLYVAELRTESRQRKMVKFVLNRRVTYVDLEAADLDNDGDVVAAEFVLYKLEELGKISKEDIALVMKEFEDLDVDQSGTLSISDITLAQSDQVKSTK